MKRDIELIRLILLREEQGTPPPPLAAYAIGLVSYNSALAIEAAFFVARSCTRAGATYR
jgi:hypothetical protein